MTEKERAKFIQKYVLGQHPLDALQITMDGKAAEHPYPARSAEKEKTNGGVTEYGEDVGSHGALLHHAR